MGKTDDRYVLDGVVTADKVFYLDGIEVFSARYNNVLLAVNELDKAILVLHRHISR